jgi:hypothetical protein
MIQTKKLILSKKTQRLNKLFYLSAVFFIFNINLCIIPGICPVSAINNIQNFKHLQAYELPQPLLLVKKISSKNHELLLIEKNMNIKTILTKGIYKKPVLGPKKDNIFFIIENGKNAEVWKIIYNEKKYVPYHKLNPQRLTYSNKFISDFNISKDGKIVYFSASDDNNGFSPSLLYMQHIDDDAISPEPKLIIQKSKKDIKSSTDSQEPLFRYSSPFYCSLSDTLFYTKSTIPFINAQRFSSMEIFQIKLSKTEIPDEKMKIQNLTETKVTGGFSGFDINGNSQGFMAHSPMPLHLFFAFVKITGKTNVSLSIYNPEKIIDIYNSEGQILSPCLSNPWLFFGERIDNNIKWFMLNMETRQKLLISLPNEIIEIGI